MSAYIGLTGYITLKMKGRSTKNFENTSVLVKSGIYKLIRHPLYFSLFLLGTGTMMKEPSRIALILGTINLIAIYITAITEEKEMVSKFGKPYEDYIKETKMFIPYII
jgi:protein-S-isoprenylcysteine O-methyltransferase Ste14